MRTEEIQLKFAYARERMTELISLEYLPITEAAGARKHQLMEEFLFHLLGGVEWTAQLLNELLGAGLDRDEVSLSRLLRHLGASHPLTNRLRSLYAQPRTQPMPADPYSDEALVYRAYNYRHQVTHRRANPFLYRIGSDPPVSLLVDPRDPAKGPSERPLGQEVDRMLVLFENGCLQVIAEAEPPLRCAV
ncbi:MAG: hypothetical protein H0U55_07485 [Rubrobacteraceae bacterium]|nr:hypothetical protein [Rubrobacteraceae bacterium]